MTVDKSIKNMSFEQALAELESIVKRIDSGQENLADAVASFEKGMVLKNHCETLLSQAKMKIEKITNNSQDSITTTEVDI